MKAHPAQADRTAGPKPAHDSETGIGWIGNQTVRHREDARPEAAGNLALQHLFRSRGIRPKLVVSQPNDEDEREADAVADQVMLSAGKGPCACASGPSPCPHCSKTSQIQRKARAPEPGAISSGHLPHLGSGRAMDHATRSFFEPRLGANLSRVRIHTDTAAADSARLMGARAYTLGSDIVFGTGEYAPGSDRGRGLLAHEIAHTLQPSRDPSGPHLRGSWYDPFVGAGEWIGSKVESGAHAVKEGAVWAGGKLYSGGKWVVNTAEEKLTAAWHCAKGVGSSLFAPISLDVLSGRAPRSLSDIVGVAQPDAAERPTSVLTTALQVIKHPCVQMLPGAGILQGGVNMVSGFISLLDAAWEIYQNPDPYIERIHASLGGMIEVATDKAKSVATAVVSNEHVDCVLRHLGTKLDYMRNNWWPILKDMGWELLWPWPGVKADFAAIWEKLKSMASNLWNLEFSRAQDDALAILRHLNAAAGRLYGWFLIGSVLVGAVLGGVAGAAAGGAAAIPGAMAGAAAGLAFAGEVGYGLLLATFAIEGASVLKASYNLTRSDRTPAEKECDCELIASSSITLGITGALALLGALAARFAKAILQRVANEFFDPAVMAPMERGRLVEARVTMGELIRARFRAKSVTVADRLTPRGLVGDGRGNFPAIDLAQDAQVTIRSQGQPITDSAGLRDAMTSGQQITVDINGGTVTQIKSHSGAGAFDAFEVDITDLANVGGNTRVVPSMTRGVRAVRVTMTNPGGRVLIGVYEPGSLTAAQITTLENLATQNGVTLRLSEGIPPDPIAVTTIESIPDILAEMANEWTDVAVDKPKDQAPCSL
jgi:hypothetical protein